MSDVTYPKQETDSRGFPQWHDSRILHLTLRDLRISLFPGFHFRVYANRARLQRSRPFELYEEDVLN